MTNIPAQFLIRTQAKADPKAVISTSCLRFSVLTSRMIRLEYNPEGTFEDRPSQIFWFRYQPVPDFEVKTVGRSIEIITDHLHLRYMPKADCEAFSQDNLSIVVRSKGSTWQFGFEDDQNLYGTLRTLDGIDGQIPLEHGLVSRSGWHVIDDSQGLVFNDEGWIEARKSNPEAYDLYFLGYGDDYPACIQDYYRVSGPPALIPRWALGNWWSRYWEYTHEELQELMLEFKAHDVPLSVCIIDMDWHITKTGNQSSGWTGYTWNRELFPDPADTLSFLHNLGLKSALNLHPALGVYPHEEMYPQMAQAMGIDPKSQAPVPFEIENPAFVLPYFELLHHPQEDEIGIDFWWMDWQQGNPSKLKGLNLLWWINHLHFFDLGRNPQKRPFIFSRWGGLGNQRYPIGFSGDTVVSWDSLAFQPYLTATAANVGFGWWSHDIGGHMNGITDAELYTRWVQFGVFSPILRLHSTKRRFLERRPWGYDVETFENARAAMQLRHTLIPYLYSMAWRDHTEGIPLTRPMYHLYPDLEQAYACPNQYSFGSELLVAPYTSPGDPETRLSRQVIWLPKDTWFDFFTGAPELIDNENGEWRALYGHKNEIPVFAKSGAIIPLAPKAGWGGIENPSSLDLLIYPGAENVFKLYEDDGVSSAYLSGEYAITSISQSWNNDQNRSEQILRIAPVEGASSVIPEQRQYNLIFKAIREPDTILVQINGVTIPAEWHYTIDEHALTVNGIHLKSEDRLEVKLSGVEIVFQEDKMTKEFEKLVHAFYLANDVKNALIDHAERIIADPTLLAAYQPALTKSQTRALIEVLTGAGIEHHTQAGEELFITWNNSKRIDYSWLLSGEQFARSSGERYRFEHEVLPAFKVIRPEKEFLFKRPGREYRLMTKIQVDFGLLLRATIVFNPKKKSHTSPLEWS